MTIGPFHGHRRRHPRCAVLAGRVVLCSAIAMAAALSACGTSQPTRYHGLETVAPAGAPSALAYGGPPLQVASVRVPPELDRQELLRQVGPGEYEVREFDHWVAPLSRLARQALSEDLASRLPPGKVAPPGTAWSGAGTYLAVDILAFGIDKNLATMELVWSLQGPATTETKALPARGGRLRLQVAAGEDSGAIARAWSSLLGQTADHVAVALGPP